MRELTQYFGRPFIKVHHIASITALAALTIHAVTVIWTLNMPSLLIPTLSAPQALALYLVVLAALAAFFRKAIGKRWKYVHWVNYLVFLMGTLHAQTLGASFRHLVIRIVSILMALIVIFLFVRKRMPKRCSPVALVSGQRSSVMPTNWMDMSQVSFNALLLLERVQLSWFPGWLPESALAIALKANPAVDMVYAPQMPGTECLVGSGDAPGLWDSVVQPRFVKLN